MSNKAIAVSLPSGARIRIGVPAEEPADAISTLRAHFGGRPAVEAAYLGLMEVMPQGSPSFFSYTVGLRCDPSGQAAEDEAVLKVLENVPTGRGRWPISVVPFNNTYFTAEAICFYERAAITERPSLLSRIFGRG
ncbi:enhanced serine sensitivity protein SseB C-terminal domain-containing protein [Xenophilus arseniciresistens]|uniref:Enhanced serine sensitivity protein SseB C-terminal domain-containing protein n=1 Tax=Xenophilus arseniciresistens TaxID=1283306 RepID=A0AAE3NFC1_9BURK|nr:enhanced serine sensitivity protein SseB C-terminal domain-containing protein [Xenophilus arseniciresistens]MDA7419247.1 enhanced serine sensitivity protein SseB C-terminal domain-containing protein [Xenophilus arseniciresistens]